jgi:hypothetical protein
MWSWHPRPADPHTIGLLFRPEGAESEVSVTIDGKLVPKSNEGDYRKELPAGRSYQISVSAGSDYESYDYTVALSAKQPVIKTVLLKYKFGSVRIVTAETSLEGAKVLINGRPQSARVDQANSALIN